MKKQFGKIFLFLFLSLLIGKPTISSSEEILRWAADAEGNAPYIFQDPKNVNNLMGFEIDIANALAAEMGMKAMHIQQSWDGLVPGLSRMDYDLAINGIEITEDRKNEVNFSAPYYYTYEQLVVLKGKKGINNLSDLVGKTAGALKNSLAERILIAKGGINVLSYEGEVNAFEDMKNGRLDACLVDAPIALYYCSWNKVYELVGQPVGEVTYGIAIRKNDTELLNRVNLALNKIATNGKLREILEHWKLWNFMMANYLKDQSQTNIQPIRYDYYINTQIGTPTWLELFYRYLSFMPKLGQAAMVTLGISIVSMIIAVGLGLMIALIRVYAPKPFSSLAIFYIEAVRGTPLLIQLLFIFFALPAIGIKLSPFVAAVIGLGCNYAAYEAENYRAGIFSVPRGQMEASISLGLTRIQTLRYVILPQAVRLVIPPVTNDFISLLKDSSLVSVITMVELTKVYGQIASTYFDYLGPGILVAIIYLIIGLPFVKLSKFVERHYSLDKRIYKRK
jgi:polar amino acid transport system substrate-binding protein